MPAWGLKARLRLPQLNGSVAVAGDVQAANPLTTATLSGPTSATTGSAVTYTVTLNVPANQTHVVTPSCAGATVNPGSFQITAGNQSGQFTVTAPSDGTYSVDFTISPTLTRAGRPISLVAASSGSAAALLADWNRRRNWSGITFQSDFSGPSDFVLASTNGGHVFGGNMDPNILARVVKDVTDGLTNGCCLRIDTPANVGANSAAWMFPLNSTWTLNSQGFPLGTDIYIQFRFKIPASRLTLSNTGGNQLGWKWANFAQYSPEDTDSQSFSNTNCEIVLQDSDQLGIPQAYHQTGVNFQPFDTATGGNTSKQSGIDKGADFSSGNRYCWAVGGVPTAACIPFPTDEWMTFMLRIRDVTFNGSAGNEFDLWFARFNDVVWTHLLKERNYTLGDPNSSGGGFTRRNGGHFLTYETNRISGAATNQKYDQPLVGTTYIPLPFNGARTGTTLGNAAASMTAGQWTQLSPANMNAVLASPAGNGASGSHIHYMNKVAWDNVNRKIHILGMDHNYFVGGQHTLRHMTYDEATNAFVLVDDTAFQNPGVTTHGYDHTVVNPYNGAVYHRYVSPYGNGESVRLWHKKNGQAEFSQETTTASSVATQIDIGVCYWSGPLSVCGPQGGIVIFNQGDAFGNSNDGQIVVFDPIANSWVHNSKGWFPNYFNSGLSFGATAAVMAYSPKHNCAVYGGGAHQQTQLYRLNSNMTKTIMPPIPTGGIGITIGNLVCDPITGNFLVFTYGSTRAQRVLYELNPSGSGSWTQVSTTIPAAIGNVWPSTSGATDQDGVISCDMPEHGVVVYMKLSSRGDPGAMYLYKHAN
jgi:hypothetical protein